MSGDAKKTDVLRVRLEELKARIDENDVLGSLVRELATQQVALEALNRQVDILKAKSRIRDIILPDVQARYRAMTSVRVDANMPLSPNSGFYGLEYSADGKGYRWTGPDAMFFFDAHISRNLPLKIVLQLGIGGAAIGDVPRCFSDNVEIPLTVRELPHGLECTGILLPRDVQGLTRVCFVASRTFRPRDSDPNSQDWRTLGVVFREFALLPASGAEVVVWLEKANLAELPPQFEDGSIDEVVPQLEGESIDEVVPQLEDGSTAELPLQPGTGLLAEAAAPADGDA